MKLNILFDINSDINCIIYKKFVFEKYYNEINLCETAMTSVYQFYIVFN